MEPSRPALHVDRLDLWQDHPNAPDWGSVLRLDLDFETGEVQREVLKSAQLEGSWDTRVLVRSSGGRVSVLGNPSKWGRLEAVGGGCRSVAEAIAVYNRILEKEGLPLFDFPEPVVVYASDGGRDHTVRRGPRIQWIHIAGNICLGSSAAVGPFFDWLSTQRVGKRGRVYEPKGPLSYAAGTRRRRESVLYGKAAEVRHRASEWSRKRTCPDRDEIKAYLGALVERLETGGWVRDEKRLCGDYLVTKGLQWAEEWSEETMWEEWQDYGISTEWVGVMSDWKTEVFDKLVERGLSARVAAQRVDVLLSWMGGRDVREGRGRAWFYQVAKDLREVIGVDIRGRPNVRTLGSGVQRVARPIEARVATEADVIELYRGLGPLSQAA